MSPLILYLLLFIVVGSLFLAVNLWIGKLLRPKRPNPEKEAIYECGEPTIGSSWIQFDLRFYVVALLFVIFDVEMAFFFPWASVFGTSNNLAKDDLPPEKRIEYLQRLDPTIQATNPELAESKIPEQRKAAKQLAWVAFADICIFFGLLLVGFAYLWKRGDLNWVRSTVAQELKPGAGT